MVSTRRGRAQGDQPAQQAASAAPAVKPRKTRKVAAPVTNGDAADTPKPSSRGRRLRSDKNAASPLQRLEEPSRKRAARSDTPKATASKSAPAQDNDDGNNENSDDEDTGLFFRDSFRKKMDSQRYGLFHMESVHSAADPAPSVQDAVVDTDALSNCEFNLSETILATENTALRRSAWQYYGELQALKDQNVELQSKCISLKENVEALSLTCDQLKSDLVEKDRLINSLYLDQAELQNQLLSLTGENTQSQPKLNGHSPKLNGHSPMPLHELTGEELLERIENRKQELIRHDTTPSTQQDHSNTAASQDNGVDDGREEAMEIVDETPATPATPAAALEVQHSTPRSTGWGLKSFFDRLIPTAFRAATPPPALVAPPATAPPRPLNSDEMQELNENLFLAETPTRKPTVKKSQSKSKRSKKASSTRVIPSQRAIITRVTQNLKPEQKSGAVEWAKKQAEVLAAQGSLGDKRKRLEQPLKIKDVKTIPSSRPWQTGSYGLLDEFWNDDSDEEGDAPEWYKLEQLTLEPPSKRQKVDVQVQGEENSPMTNTTSSPFATSSFTASSSSLMSISHTPNSGRPRPSTTPSPMFDSPVMHSSSQNIFEEQRIQSTPEKNHIPGSFSNSDNFSDGGQEGRNGSSSPWTQAPPPPPAPAHASLPTPVSTAPSVPVMTAETFFPPSDPVKDARKEAMKYTPAKPSRLRNVVSQSPIPGALAKKLNDAKSFEYTDSTESNDPELDAFLRASLQPSQGIDPTFRAKINWNAPAVAEHIFKDDPQMMELIENAPKATGNELWYAEIKAGYEAVAKTIRPFA